jgi:choline kinase
MKAIIAAAGRSSRLYPLTSETPKGLLPIGETSILERSIDLLNAAGIADVIVVVGFCHEKIRRQLHGRARFVLNPFFAETNNMGSLWLAIPHTGGDAFVYLHADVIYHEDMLVCLLADGRDADIQLLTDFDSVDAEAMKVRVEDGRFVESSKAIPLDSAAGEWTGLARVAPSAAQPLYECIETLLAEGRLQDYDTAAFTRLAQAGMRFGLTPTSGLPWCEIDTPADLARARALFADRATDLVAGD